MIKKALKEITTICDDEEINRDNYLDSLDYLDNVYKVIITIQPDLSIDDLDFLPSYKSALIVGKCGILSTTEENELRYFKIKSHVFLDDKNKLKHIIKEFEKICSRVVVADDILEITLK